jgi:hypothetical protein
MVKTLPAPLREALTDTLATSLTADWPSRTTRQVHGRVEPPGKVTAVAGMCRAGKTTLVHQLRQQKLALSIPRVAVPYINFEDER